MKPFLLIDTIYKLSSIIISNVNIMSFDSSSLFPIDSTRGVTVLPTEHNTSLYVPVVPPSLYFSTSTSKEMKRFEPKYLKYYIENCVRIGKIKRIDFAVREVPNFRTPQTCAFIHFDCLYDNDATRIIFDKLQTSGKYKDFGFDNGKEYCKFGLYNQLDNKAHLLFKVNHKPIEQRDEYAQNIEQVYAANKILTEKLQEKEEMVRQLTDELARMKSTLVEFSGHLDSPDAALYQRVNDTNGEETPMNMTIYPEPKDDKPMTLDELM